ncbi:hypothetical protein TVAG_168350 [Trichomonas vaginalis G3]|uniref:Uncharacterized protein n=1 Tax=Trichomonas vaginalis (strain ATCC PRA-98 / G3) TaxID=412133 RepID=A2F2D8_TRIV3|nr:hypothetical protein TVAGG3_0252870 [Trichomonas vaginalis G3]EAY00904.1 hypothetical protein TVAG_168350 [Trichomonas vaginalis G3]KAI5554143.1 hypothetical protein TVAGG3_0252870 [Trichomonas vaginalis G3]|eukprot:XP_001313833.1 hypothetical protein [Trichomonas vaginalis G3]
MFYKYITEEEIHEGNDTEVKLSKDKISGNIPIDILISEAYKLALCFNSFQESKDFLKGIAASYRYISEFHDPLSILVLVIHRFITFYNETIIHSKDISGIHEHYNEFDHIQSFGTTRSEERIGNGRFCFIYEKGKFYEAQNNNKVVNYPTFNLMRSKSGLIDVDSSIPVWFQSIVITPVSQDLWDYEEDNDQDYENINGELINDVISILENGLIVPWFIDTEFKTGNIMNNYDFINELHDILNADIYGDIRNLDISYFNLWEDLPLYLIKSINAINSNENGYEDTNINISVHKKIDALNFSCSNYSFNENEFDLIDDSITERNEILSFSQRIFSVDKDIITPIYVMGIESLKTFFSGTLKERCDYFMTDNKSIIEIFLHSIFVDDGSCSIINIAKMLIQDVVDSNIWKEAEMQIDNEVAQYLNGMICMIKCYIQVLKDKFNDRDLK